MAALDTNVLPRYIVEDDALQLAAATRLISRCVADGSTRFVPVTVVLELEWVLRSNYRFEKADVLRTLSGLFSTVELTFESEHSLEVALQLFGRTSADFADSLHIASATCAANNRCGLSTKVQRRSAVPGCSASAARLDDGVVQVQPAAGHQCLPRPRLPRVA